MAICSSMDFSCFEETDGIRMTWNVWPTSRVEAARCVVPFAAMYTPNKRLPNMPVLPYEPVPCKHCGGILNPHARVDFFSKFWTCPLCNTRNHFPVHYQGISEQNLPAELYSSYGTIEYELRRMVAPHPPVYLFLIDTCVHREDDLNACRTAVLQAISTLPEDVHVGLVTFGRHVHVYELGFTQCTKCFVFRGSKEYTNQQILEQIGARRGLSQWQQRQWQRHGTAAALPPAGPSSMGLRFLMPLGEVEFTLTQAIEELQKDAYPVGPTSRPLRCTGTAIQVAAALLGSALPVGSCQARILALIGGPCTEGPGKVVGSELAEGLRSHKDIAKDAAPHYRKAKKFYEQVAEDLVHNGHTLDIFACSLDQVGLAEMRDAVGMTGGIVVQTDTFHNNVFRESLKRVLLKEADEGFLGMTSNATLEVIPSKDIKVAGLLGPAARMEKKSPHISETEVGCGGTTQWKICGMDAETTLAVVMQVAGSSKDAVDAGAMQASSMLGRSGPQLFLQFITRYLHWSGRLRCRVTTVSRRYTEDSNVADMITGFDQEAAAVVMARLASFQMEHEEDFDATRWLDRALIRLASRFGDFRKDDAASFNLRPELSFYPQFMFNLRRSQFVQVFGNSPDETACCRLALLRVSVPDAMVMIQPQLTAYEFSQRPFPVLLDVQSILPNRILLMDAYFYVVIFHGQTIAQWRKAGYQLQPEHEAFRQLLEAPQQEARDIMARRFPVPRLVDCDHQGSQARFLLVKLNPSATHTSTAPMSAEVINTDDVSLATFTEHLKHLAVQA